MGNFFSKLSAMFMVSSNQSNEDQQIGEDIYIFLKNDLSINHTNNIKEISECEYYFFRDGLDFRISVHENSFDNEYKVVLDKLSKLSIFELRGTTKTTTYVTTGKTEKSKDLSISQKLAKQIFKLTKKIYQDNNKIF
jgi:hypothetical protein